MNNATTEFERHANQSRASAKRHGLADCIHYADNWQPRIDALYKEANESGLRWWEGVGCIGLLPDGRMVLTSPIVSFVEFA